MHCPQPESHLNFIATLVLHRLHSRDNKEDISALNHASVTFFSKKNEKTQKATPPKLKEKKIKNSRCHSYKTQHINLIQYQKTNTHKWRQSLNSRIKQYSCFIDMTSRRKSEGGILSGSDLGCTISAPQTCNSWLENFIFYANSSTCAALRSFKILTLRHWKLIT